MTPRALAAIVALVIARAAAADEAAEIDVHVTVAAPPHDEATTRALERTVREYAELVATEARIDRRAFGVSELLRPAAGGARVQAWIDLRRRGEARLYLLDVASSQAAVRTFARRGGRDALMIEELALAFRTLLGAAAAGEPLGDDVESVRQELAEPPPASPRSTAIVEAPASPPTPAPPALAIAATYGIGWLAADVEPLHGPGVALSLGPGAHGRGAYIHAEAQHAFSVEHAATALVTRVDASGARLSVGFRAAVSTHARVGVGAGLGADWVRARATPSSGSGLVATPSSAALEPVARGFCAWSYELRPPIALVLELLIDVELRDVAFAVRDAGRVAVVLDPWPVRPWLRAGVAF